MFSKFYCRVNFVYIRGRITVPLLSDRVITIPRLRGLKQQFYHTRGICGSGVGKGHNGGSLSLSHEVRGLGRGDWKTVGDSVTEGRGPLIARPLASGA